MHQRRKNEDTCIKNFINVKNQYPIISYRRPLYEKCVTNLKKKNTARFNLNKIRKTKYNFKYMVCQRITKLVFIDWSCYYSYHRCMALGAFL